MKKHINILILSLAVLAGTSSCSDWLEVLPENQMILEEYWKTESDAQSVMSACYRGLIEPEVITRMMIWGEFRSDDFTKAYNSEEDINKILVQEVTPSNSYCKWSSFYSVINTCNTFLKYAPGVLNEDDNFTPAKLHAMEAEVKTIRALTYFYLVRAYRDIPYITQPSVDDAQDYQYAQLPDSVVLDSIVGDLTYALQYATESFDNVKYQKGRVTRNAVLAILADVLLWKGDNLECVAVCDQILADADLKLVDADNVIKKVFYEGNSTESIFELQFDDVVQANTSVESFYGWSGNVTPALGFPTNLAPGKQYSPFEYQNESLEDYRSKDFYKTDVSSGVYTIFKYSGLSRTENSTTKVSTYVLRSNTPNWILYRLSEIYLIKAEALLELTGDENSVVNLVNVVYKRSNPDADDLDPTDYDGYNDLQKLILRERQRELMFEGKRWFDLVRVSRRTNSTAQLISYVAKTTSGNEALGKMSVMNAIYWPIHKDELLANKLLKQNPFYNSVSTSSN